MIECTFSLINSDMIDIDDLETFVALLRRDLKQKCVFLRYYKTIDTFISSNNFVVQFHGIMAGSPDVLHLFSRFISSRLNKLGISSFIYISGHANTSVEGDFILKKEDFSFNYTNNTVLLQPYIDSGLLDESNIPDKYKCALTEQVMDTPIHLSGNSDIYYNKSTFLSYLYSQPRMLNPFTRNPIDINKDICVDHQLKEEIKTYIKSTLETCLNKKRELFIKIINKYTSDGVTINNIHKSLRCAAAQDNVDDMIILSRKAITLNDQDDNPQKHYTALHWAVKKNALNAAKFLLSHDSINLDVKDAKGKSAVDLVIEEGSTEMRNLFSEKLRHQRLFEELPQNFSTMTFST